MIDPRHASWVKDHWGEQYLHRENVFYRMLVISALTAHARLRCSRVHVDLLRDQVKSLAEELDASPHGLLDDYPGQCYPADVLAAVAAIRRADSVLGTDHADFVRRSIRGFQGRCLDERGLVLACLAVDGAHVWDPDSEVRIRNHQNALAHIEAAESLGAQSVRIDIGGQSPIMTAEQLDVVVERFREYARRAGENGYRLGPENHFGPALVPENMRRIYEAVDLPAYGVLLHVGHWVEGREDEGDELVAPWTYHTHLDWITTTTCLSSKMAMLRDAGYDGFWGVEHHTGTNEYSEVAIQVAMVRDVLERWL